MLVRKFGTAPGFFVHGPSRKLDPGNQGTGDLRVIFGAQWRRLDRAVRFLRLASESDIYVIPAISDAICNI